VRQRCAALADENAALSASHNEVESALSAERTAHAKAAVERDAERARAAAAEDRAGREAGRAVGPGHRAVRRRPARQVVLGDHLVAESVRNRDLDEVLILRQAADAVDELLQHRRRIWKDA